MDGGASRKQNGNIIITVSHSDNPAEWLDMRGKRARRAPEATEAGHRLDWSTAKSVSVMCYYYWLMTVSPRTWTGQDIMVQRMVVSVVGLRN